MYILDLIHEHHEKLKNLKVIAFDYIRGLKELTKIRKFNQKLSYVNFPILVSVKLMNNMIRSHALDSIIRGCHKLQRFYLSAEDEQDFKRDIKTLKECWKEFFNLTELVIFMDLAGIEFDLLIFQNKLA